MDNFIWFGGHLLNLDYVIHFTLEEDTGRVIALINGNGQEETVLTVDGDCATAVRAELASISRGKIVSKSHHG